MTVVFHHVKVLVLRTLAMWKYTDAQHNALLLREMRCHKDMVSHGTAFDETVDDTGWQHADSV